MKVIQATISEKLNKDVEELVRSRVFKDASEVVRTALQKMLAEQSREYLRELTKIAGVKENAMLNEWKRIRR